MTIARRLLILVAVPLLALVALAFLTWTRLARVEDRSRFVSESRIVALGTIAELAVTFERLRVDVRIYVLATSPADQIEARRRFDLGEEAIERLLKRYAGIVFSDQGRRLLGEFQVINGQWIVGARQVMAAVDEGHRDDAIALLNNKWTDVGARVMVLSREWIDNNQQLANDAGQDALSAIQGFRTTMLAAIALSALLATSFGLVTFRRIAGPLSALQASVDAIAAGDYARAVPFTRATDETGALARSISVLKEGAGGLEEQRWMKSHASAVTRELQSAASLTAFGERLLSGLVPLLGGGAAGFFANAGEGEPLRRVSAYGLADDANGGDPVATGQGLVGQCARERRIVTLTDLPAGYMRIASGLGSAPPVTATAWPLLVQDALVGVVEIATFRPIEGRERLLLEPAFEPAAWQRFLRHVTAFAFEEALAELEGAVKAWT